MDFDELGLLRIFEALLAIFADVTLLLLALLIYLPFRWLSEISAKLHIGKNTLFGNRSCYGYGYARNAHNWISRDGAG